MAHPYAGHRQNKVEHDRVSAITKGYATGGAVSSNAALPEPVRRQLNAKSNGVGIPAGAGKQRSDKAPRGMRKAAPVTDFEKGQAAKTMRATGGRVKSGKGTNVNIMISPSAPQQPGQPVPVPVPVPAGGPPPGAVPPGAMAGGPPPGLPPGMPMPGRKKGGRVVQAPGSVGSGRGAKVMAGSLGSMEGDIPRKSGKFEGPGGNKGQIAVKMDAGAGSGEGRLEKSRIQKRRS